MNRINYVFLKKLASEISMEEATLMMSRLVRDLKTNKYSRDLDIYMSENAAFFESKAFRR